MRVTLINVGLNTSIGNCPKCRSEMAHVNENSKGQLMIRCVGCGIVRGTTAKETVSHRCPSCYETKLNLATGECGNCNYTTTIDFLKPVDVTHKDDEKKFKRTL